MLKSIEWEAAVEQMSRLTANPKTQTVPLEEAAGRILAETVCARFAMPPFPKSPFDGFAVNAGTLPGTLPISAVIPAGEKTMPTLRPGTAARIFTGAPVPVGADVVFKQEDTEYDSQTVRIQKTLPPGSNVILAGEDYPSGTVLASAGDRLTPSQLGLIASQGLGEVTVYRRPRVVILSTGSELSAPGTCRSDCGIYNSSYYTLRGYLEAMGFSVAPPRIVPDDLEQIQLAIREAMDSDAELLITTGGASVGDYDYALESAQTLGGEILFWKVRMKPGSALLVARKGEKVLLGLSGNPAAALMSVLTVLQPYLRRLTGRAWQQETLRLPLYRPMPKSSNVARCLRGHLKLVGSQAYFEENAGRGNGNLASFRECSLIGIVPPNSGPLAQGQEILVLPMPADLCFL